jgi:hypothetical protein
MSLYILRRGTFVKPIKPTKLTFVTEKEVKLSHDISLKDANYYAYAEAIESGHIFVHYVFGCPIKGYDGFLYYADDVHVERL